MVMNTEQVGSSLISVPSNNRTDAPELIPKQALRENYNVKSHMPL